MQFLKQSTTVTVQMGPALDKTDGVTAETALSPTVYLSKGGAAQAARTSATAITHDRDGFYRVELDTTDTDTLGRLLAQFSAAATHLPVWHEYMVVPANVYDSLVAATASLNVVLTTGGVDAVHDDVLEGSLTFRQATRIMLAALAGKATGGGTTSVAFRDNADAKDRIAATVDSSGNRTAVTLDGT
jgi:hypothetical protein